MAKNDWMTYGGIAVVIVIAGVLFYVYTKEKELHRPDDPPYRFPFNLIFGGPPA